MAMVCQWHYNGMPMALQWHYNGMAMALQWYANTMDCQYNTPIQWIANTMVCQYNAILNTMHPETLKTLRNISYDFSQNMAMATPILIDIYLLIQYSYNCVGFYQNNSLKRYHVVACLNPEHGVRRHLMPSPGREHSVITYSVR